MCMCMSMYCRFTHIEAVCPSISGNVYVSDGLCAPQAVCPECLYVLMVDSPFIPILLCLSLCDHNHAYD